MSFVESGCRRADEAVEVDLVARSSVNVMVTASDADDRLSWARRIHDGARRDGPFVAVFPATNRQARAADVDDWFARAAQGTLFIDGVGRLGDDAQARLGFLLTAQSHCAEGTTPRDGNDRVRVIAGSNRSLRTDLAAGTFTEGLFYRLNVIHIDLMPTADSSV